MMTPNIEKIIERMKLSLAIETDSELARALNIGRQTLGNWKSRGTIPYTECLQLSAEKNISLDWLLTGEGEMYKNLPNKAFKTQEEMMAYKVTPQLTPREIAVLKMFNSLTEEEKQDIQKTLEEKKRLADIEAKMQQLTEELEKIKRSV